MMLHFSSQTSSTIRHVRVKAGRFDPHMARQLMAKALTTLPLHPQGLNPSAILCVRSLRLCGVDLEGWQRKHEFAASEWEGALVELLGQVARRAIRPSLGAVPANAEAVLFADRAELLACLADDWVRGEATLRWWWQTLFGQGGLTEALLAAWLDAPEYVPAALEQLAAKGQAVSFVSALPQQTSQALLPRVLERFGLVRLVRVMDAPPHLLAAKGMGDGGQSVNVDDPWRPAGIGATVPPWRAWVGEGKMGSLSREQAVLLGVALMVQRAPSVVRSDAFAQATSRWWWQEAVARKDEARPSIALVGQAPEQAKASVQRRGQRARMNFGATDEGEMGKILPAPTPMQDEGGGQRGDSHSKSDSHPEAEGGEKDETLTLAPLVDEGDEADEQEVAPVITKQAVATDSLPVTEREPLVWVETSFGGLFYLINLGLYLELYGDFTTPLQPGIALDIFDFVAMVGERWFGEALRADPLWRLLAELAGRAPDEPPGLDFVPPDGQTLAAWFAALMATIEERLAVALDVEGDAIARLLALHPARIGVSRTHLDIYLSLAQLPIAIRLCGLDRNPGWVPAAGRYVTFYFE